jgi:NAD(P)-dependent dehydrogenase (short-subunit alcohol dehydrogenase family)
VLEGKGDSIAALDDIRFEPITNGTRLIYTADLSFQGIIGLVEPFMRGLLDKVGKDAVAGLRAALSEEPPVPDYSWSNAIMDRLIIPGMLGFTEFGYRWRKGYWKPLAVSLAGRTAVVTGATAGLGRAAAERLASLGARLILVGRNREKAESVCQAMQAATGNTNLAVEIADLSLLAEVRKLAEGLLQNEAKIHVLVNNAGVLLNERSTTAEGIETTLATNLLAPFLLTNLLLPRLKECAPARIINVSSGGMYTSGIDVADLQYQKSSYNGSRAYARTKRALVILTEIWAEQLEGSGVVVHAMHPGWADTPGVETSLPLFYKLTKPFLRTPEEGADTIVWLAASPEAAKSSGRFWLDREPHITHVFPGTQETPQERQQLWDALAELCGRQKDE